MAVTKLEYNSTTKQTTIEGDAGDIWVIPVNGGPSPAVPGWDGHTWLGQVRDPTRLDIVEAPIASFTVISDTSDANGPAIVFGLDTATLVPGTKYRFDIEATDVRDTKLRGILKANQDVSHT